MNCIYSRWPGWAELSTKYVFFSFTLHGKNLCHTFALYGLIVRSRSVMGSMSLMNRINAVHVIIILILIVTQMHRYHNNVTSWCPIECGCKINASFNTQWLFNYFMVWLIMRMYLLWLDSKCFSSSKMSIWVYCSSRKLLTPTLWWAFFRKWKVLFSTEQLQLLLYADWQPQGGCWGFSQVCNVNSDQITLIEQSSTWQNSHILKAT